MCESRYRWQTDVVEESPSLLPRETRRDDVLSAYASRSEAQPRTPVCPSRIACDQRTGRPYSVENITTRPVGELEDGEDALLAHSGVRTCGKRRNGAVGASWRRRAESFDIPENVRCGSLVVAVAGTHCPQLCTSSRESSAIPANRCRTNHKTAAAASGSTASYASEITHGDSTALCRRIALRHAKLSFVEDTVVD